MGTDRLLDRLQIASPCGESWANMTGDDHARHCDRCQLTVYNLSALTQAEAEHLILSREGRLCARLHRRRDGTVITADCPVGVATKKAGRRRRWIAAAALALGLVGLGAWKKGWARAGGFRWDFPPAPINQDATFKDWGDWALICLGVKEPEPAGVMGMVGLDFDIDDRYSASDY